MRLPATASPLVALLARGAIGSLFLRLVSIGLLFGLQVFLARLMGIEEYGRYVYVLAWFEVLLLVGTMGWDTAALRFLPSYCGTGEHALCRGYLRASRIVPLTVSVGLAALVAMVVLAARGRLDPALPAVFLAGCILLPLNTQLQLAGAGLQAFRQVIFSQLPQLIARPIAMACVVLVAYAWEGRQIGAVQAMAANAVAAGLTLALASHRLRKSTPAEVRAAPPAYRLHEWLHVAFPMFLIAGCYLMMQRLDVLMIGTMLGTAEAGIYAVAVRLSEFSVLGITAVNMVTTPMFAELHAAGRRKELQRTVALGSAAVVAVSLPAILFVWLFGGWLLRLFGEQFATGLPALRVILVGPMVATCTWAVGFLASMTGHQRQSAMGLAIAVAVNAALNLVLIPPFGMIGAAAASALSLSLWQVAMVALIRRAVGVDPTVMSLGRLRAAGSAGSTP